MRINVKYDKYERSLIYVAKFQSPVAGTQMLLDVYLLKGKSNLLLSGLFYFSYKSRVMIQCELCYFGMKAAFCNIMLT